MTTDRLSYISTEDLLAEIARRNQRKQTVPQPLSNPDFTRLREMVIDGIKDASVKQFQDDDFKHYVYESAVEAVFGKDFWAWRNSQLW